MLKHAYLKAGSLPKKATNVIREMARMTMAKSRVSPMMSEVHMVWRGRVKFA